MSLSLYFCVGSSKQFSLSVRITQLGGSWGLVLRFWIWDNLGYWWSLGLHFYGEITWRDRGDQAQVWFVSVQLPGVFLVHYSRIVTGMMQKRLVQNGPGTVLLKNLWSSWRGCGRVVLHSSMGGFGFWVRGDLSQSPLGQEDRFWVVYLLVCINLWNQEWNFQGMKWRGQIPSKYSGSDWEESHLAGREEPQYWVLLSQLLKSSHLKEFCKMQAHTHTFFFRCLTWLNFVSEKNILSISLFKILAKYCNIRHLHSKNYLILETTENQR